MTLRAWLISLAAFALITAVVILIAKDQPPPCQTTKCLEGM